MPDSATVSKMRDVSVGARYPADRAKLLEVLKERRGDRWVSDTIRWALDSTLIRAGLLSQTSIADSGQDPSEDASDVLHDPKVHGNGSPDPTTSTNSVAP